MFLEPIPAVLSHIWDQQPREDEPVLLLGYLEDDRMLYADVEGRLSSERLDRFVTDWRYNPEKKTWDDVNSPLEDEAEDDLDEE